MTSECYKTSCWCAPIRWLFPCCSTPTSPTLQPITQVMVNAMNNQPTPTASPLPQDREITWKITNGGIAYQISHSVIRSVTRNDINNPPAL